MLVVHGVYVRPWSWRWRGLLSWIPAEVVRAAASNDGKKLGTACVTHPGQMREEQINPVHAEVSKVISSTSENSCAVGVSVGDCQARLQGDCDWSIGADKHCRIAVTRLLLEGGRRGEPWWAWFLQG